jgi:predicted transglutaminase-like cysteine proteinase
LQVFSVGSLETNDQAKFMTALNSYLKAFATATTLVCAGCAGIKVDTPRKDPLYASLGDVVRAPDGWIEFCLYTPDECSGGTTQPRDIVLSQTAWRDLLKVNRWVNENVKPMTDVDHWGVAEKWSLPTDGYGDCEDYVLLKRKLLIDAKWPREALLITVVRDRNGEGHAVLTVKTDKGEFILDNQNENVVAWTEAGYQFVKRQSQSDPNTWVSLGEARSAIITTKEPIPPVDMGLQKRAVEAALDAVVPGPSQKINHNAPPSP